MVIYSYRKSASYWRIIWLSIINYYYNEIIIIKTFFIGLSLNYIYGVALETHDKLIYFNHNK